MTIRDTLHHALVNFRNVPGGYEAKELITALEDFINYQIEGKPLELLRIGNGRVEGPLAPAILKIVNDAIADYHAQTKAVLPPAALQPRQPTPEERENSAKVTAALTKLLAAQNQARMAEQPKPRTFQSMNPLDDNRYLCKCGANYADHQTERDTYGKPSTEGIDNLTGEDKGERCPPGPSYDEYDRPSAEQVKFDAVFAPGSQLYKTPTFDQIVEAQGIQARKEIEARLAPPAPTCQHDLTKPVSTRHVVSHSDEKIITKCHACGEFRSYNLHEID